MATSIPSVSEQTCHQHLEEQRLHAEILSRLLGSERPSKGQLPPILGEGTEGSVGPFSLRAASEHRTSKQSKASTSRPRRSLKAPKDVAFRVKGHSGRLGLRGLRALSPWLLELPSSSPRPRRDFGVRASPTAKANNSPPPPASRDVGTLAYLLALCVPVGLSNKVADTGVEREAKAWDESDSKSTAACFPRHIVARTRRKTIESVYCVEKMFCLLPCLSLYIAYMNMKLRNVIEIALRRNAPDWLKELIEEDDARITKH